MDILKQILIAIIPLNVIIGCGNSKAVSETVNEEMPQVECVGVDLGLPSGTLWAESNLGASSSEEPGYFFFWGEDEPFQLGSRYKYVNDAYYDGGDSQYLKYITNEKNGRVDGLTELEPMDDAAVILAGDGWEMPAVEDIDELFGHCTWKLDNLNNQDGITFVGPNGNTLFFPYYFGYWTERGYYLGGADYIYWSKSLVSGSLRDETDDDSAYGIRIRIWDEGCSADKDFTYRTMLGHIRPVHH